MTDYISREAVLALTDDYELTLDDDEIFFEYIDPKKVAALPAADVRPVVRGKWEDVFVRDYSTNINGGMELHVASMFCPICHRWHNEVYHYGNPTEMAHFCSNCGADMREES